MVEYGHLNGREFKRRLLPISKRIQLAFASNVKKKKEVQVNSIAT